MDGCLPALAAPLLRAAALCAALAAATAARAHDRGEAGYGEHTVEAALAYNVLKFVEWPADAPLQRSASLALCVLGDDDLAVAAEATLAGKAVGGRPVAVRTVASVAEAAACHAVFLGRVPDVERAAFLLGDAGVVTFGDRPGFGAAGVLFTFFPEGGRIRFAVNLEAAARAGVRVSSKVLSLARVAGEERR
jgi:hypothetical protein